MIVVLIIISVGSFLFIRAKQLPTRESNTSTSTVSIESWKTYNNSELGFTAKYPQSWRILNSQSDIVSFSLPNDMAGEPFLSSNSGVQVWVTVSINTSYSNLQDYKNYIDELERTNEGSWNTKDLGYEQINGREFLKYSWAHQDSGFNYATMSNGKILEIDFRMGGILYFDKSQDYKDFLMFLSNIKFTD